MENPSPLCKEGKINAQVQLRRVFVSTTVHILYSLVNVPEQMSKVTAKNWRVSRMRSWSNSKVSYYFPDYQLPPAVDLNYPQNVFELPLTAVQTFIHQELFFQGTPIKTRVFGKNICS